MHDNQTKDKFIELRAKGISLDKISEQLDVSKGAVYDWELRFKPQIQRLRAVELQAIQERVLSGYEQELTYLAEELKRVQAELRDRDYGYCNTEQLYWYQGALFSRIDKKCAPLDIPEPAREDAPISEATKSDQKRPVSPGGHNNTTTPNL